MRQATGWLLLGTILMWPLFAAPDSETTWRALAERGDADAQYNLAVTLSENSRIPGDTIEAVLWYRRAAEQGHNDARYRLGWMYAEGWGVPENYAKATRWFRMAAEQGHVEAQFSLGTLNDLIGGLPENRVQAYAWYIVAAAQGIEDARTSKDNLAKTMDSAEITAAQTLAVEYWEAHVLPFQNGHASPR